MSFPAYSSYQVSAVEWLGDVPSDWSIERLRIRANLITSKAEAQTRPIALENIEGWSGKLIETETEFENDGVDFEVGDILFGKLRPYLAKVYAAEFPGQAVGDFHVIRPAVSANTKFLAYCLLTRELISLIDGSTYGAKMPRASWDFIREVRFAFPSLGEQVAIAAFLDRETAKIDALIEEQRRLIALLKEKRQAVISQAVTKGLDPHLPMKDSGIEWLGEVPAHWHVVPLKFLASVQTGLAKGKDHGDAAIVRLPYLRVANVQNGHLNLEDVAEIDVLPADVDRYRLRAGDVLMNEGGDFDKLGRGDVWQEQIATCLHQNHVFAVRPTKVPSSWLNLVNGSDYAQRFFVLRSKQTTNLASISSSNLMELPVVMPPIDEQSDIEGAVFIARSKLDALTGEAKRAIELLIERRGALISAAVTGTIDVRDSATVLPFPIDRARARGLIAAEIIERSAHQPTFGRVKFQKIAFLAEAHIGISELAGSYTREAAGPLDRILIAEMEGGAHSIAGVVVDQAGGIGTAVSYRLGQRRDGHRQELVDWLGADRAGKLDKLIAEIAGLTTKDAEAVATLFGVWNDLLIDGLSPSDSDIIYGFINDWHPEKCEKFRAGELPIWLDWMRRRGIVPTGSGPKTITGRLFV